MLYNKSLKGQSSDPLNFEGANICGISFSDANLTNANFRGAKAGIPLFWLAILMLGLFLLTALTSLVVSFACSVVIIPLKPSPIQIPAKLLWESLLPLIISLRLLWILIRRGAGAELVSWSVLLTVIITFLGAVIQPNEMDSVGRYIIILAVLKTVCLAGMIAGILVASVAIASSLAIFDWRFLILVGILAVPGSLAGIAEASKPNADLLNWVLSLGLTTAAFTCSFLMGSNALKGDKKFQLIQSVAIWLATFKGTRFIRANLTDADFTGAKLDNTDLRFANLTRTCWFRSQGLNRARTWGTYLHDISIRCLVVSGHGQQQNFDHQDLRGLNLRHADLTDISLVAADLSNADLQDANLSRSKLVQTQLYNTRLNRACLTGAYIQDWGISLDTQFDQVRCEYVYMHLPTPEDPDPCRKPDNREEIFEPGDFADFITPIIKTLDLYKRQNVDPRVAAKTYKTVDLFHHNGIDPSAAAIALQRLAEQHPESGLEVVALEGRGNDKIRLQARVSAQSNPSQLSKEYFEQYHEVKELAYSDLQALLRGIEEKDERIRSLENIVMTAVQQKTFYVETYQNLGDTVTEKSSININAGGDIGSLSGIVSGNMSGVMNLGTVSGNLTNTIGQLPDDSETKAELKALLQQLQAAIEVESELSSEDKAEALEQVQTLAEAGQNPEDGALQKTAKTAIKILKGTTSGLSETANLAIACAKLLPAISSLLLLIP